MKRTMAKVANSANAVSGCLTTGKAALLDTQRQSHQAPPAWSRQSTTVKIGTKKRSNCSRERWAAKSSASLDSKRVEPERDLVSSSNSSFSMRSLSSSRIWNQLTAATRKPRPRKRTLTWPARELERRATMKAATPTANRAKRLINPFFCMLRSMSTQFTFFKKDNGESEGSAHVADDVDKGFSDVAPVEGAFAGVERIGEPEKLPIGHDGVKY